MWFIGVEIEIETSALLKKTLDPPLMQATILPSTPTLLDKNLTS